MPLFTNTPRAHLSTRQVLINQKLFSRNRPISLFFNEIEWDYFAMKLHFRSTSLSLNVKTFISKNNSSMTLYYLGKRKLRKTLNIEKVMRSLRCYVNFDVKVTLIITNFHVLSAHSQLWWPMKLRVEPTARDRSREREGRETTGEE